MDYVYCHLYHLPEVTDSGITAGKGFLWRFQMIQWIKLYITSNFIPFTGSEHL